MVEGNIVWVQVLCVGTFGICVKVLETLMYFCVFLSVTLSARVQRLVGMKFSCIRLKVLQGILFDLAHCALLK